MHGRRRFAAAAVALAVVLAAGPRAGAVSYHNVDAGFSLRSPPRWTHISPGRLQQLVEAMMKPDAKRPTFVAGFASAADARIDPPYILIQYMPGRVSFGEATASLARATAADLRSSDLFRSEVASQFSVDGDPQTTADAAAHRFTMRMMMTTPVGPVRGSSVGFVGRDGTVVVHCYALAGRAKGSADAFQSTVDSFAFDAGHDYDAAVNDPPLRLGNAGALGGLLAAGAGAGWAIRRRWAA